MLKFISEYCLNKARVLISGCGNGILPFGNGKELCIAEIGSGGDFVDGDKMTFSFLEDNASFEDGPQEASEDSADAAAA